MSGPTFSHPTARAQWEVALPGLRASVVPFLLSRVIVLVALGTARLCVTSFNMGASARGASRSGLLAWDAHWYERIAAHGYGSLGNGALRFFPLLAVLARSFRAVPGMPAGLAVVVVANAASFAAFVVLYRLVIFELGDEACARRAVWLLALAPPAFVLVMGYAESLLLVTSLVAILGLRQHRYALAIFAGFAAGLSRPVGVLVVIPAAIEVAANWGSLQVRERVIGVGAVLAAPARRGRLSRLGPRGRRELPAPAARAASRSRRGTVSDPFVTFARDAVDLLHGSHFGTTEHAFWAVLFLLLAVFIFRRLPAAYGWYTIAVLVGRVDSLQFRVPRAVRARLLPLPRSGRDADQGSQDLPSRDRALRLTSLRLCRTWPFSGNTCLDDAVRGSGPWAGANWSCDDGATMTGGHDSSAGARQQDTARPGRVVVVGAGPAGMTAAYELAKRARSARSWRWTAWSGGIARTVEREGWRVRHRRASFLHKGARGRESVAGDPRTGGLPVAAQAEPDLLRGDLLQLSDPARKRSARSRTSRVDEVRTLIPLGAPASPEGSRHLRRLDREGIRVASLPKVLQGLHREGMGDTGGRDQGRLGETEDQEPDTGERDQERFCPRPGTRPASLHSSRSSTTPVSDPE